MFLECSALISKYSRMPFLTRSSFSNESVILSILLRTVINFLFNFLNLVNISRSSLLRFSEPSNKKIIKLDSSAAIHACSAISSLRIDSSWAIPPVSIIKLSWSPKVIYPWFLSLVSPEKSETIALRDLVSLLIKLIFRH